MSSLYRYEVATIRPTKIKALQQTVYYVNFDHIMDKQYIQAQFDCALLNFLLKEKSNGNHRVKVIAKNLHDNVVTDVSYNGMPMACKSMWKLYSLIGGEILYSTPSKQSSKIEIEYCFE